MVIQTMQMAEPSGHSSYRIKPGLERPGGSQVYSFANFLALPAARMLTCDGDPVEIGSRAFDLLVVLLRSKGAIVSKDEITRFVWPSTTVDESNLRFQMTCLRRALGGERDRIKTIPGRGYLFVDEELPPVAGEEPLFSIDRLTEARPRLRKPAIVIIDEDPDNREALHRLLRPFHAHVQSFVSVEAFLASDSTHPRAPESAPPCPQRNS